MPETTKNMLPGDSDAAIERAAGVLAKGGLVAIPTETVYGLAARADDERAVAAVFAAKGRPADNPLTLLVAGADAAQGAAQLNDAIERLMSAFWPGPLTIVAPLKLESLISKLATAGGATLGVRCPDHPVAQRILERVDFPLVAPSANTSGTPGPTTAAQVLADLGNKVDLIIDGGPSSVGKASTVVDMTGDKPRILRAGAVPLSEIERVIRKGSKE